MYVDRIGYVCINSVLWLLDIWRIVSMVLNFLTNRSIVLDPLCNYIGDMVDLNMYFFYL